MKNKKQHFIPVSYQKGFAEEYPENIKKKADEISLFVYDKTTKEVFRKGLNNLFQYPHYYSIFRNDGIIDPTIEKELAKHESNMARISRILYQDHIQNKLDRCRLLEYKNIKKTLAYCVHLQLKRVPKHLKKTEAIILESGKIEGK